LVYNSHKLLFRGVSDAYNKELLFGVQLELIKAGNMYTGKYSGFNTTDEGILAVLLTFITQKIAEFNHIEVIKKKDKKFSTTLSFVTKLLESKTIFQLISNVRDYAGELLGYQYAGILYYLEPSTYKYLSNSQQTMYILRN